MIKVIIYIIKGYQYISRNIISKQLVPLIIPLSCRFYPSCSEYSIEAFSKYGFWKGLYKSSKRILKCNPLFSAKPDIP